MKNSFIFLLLFFAFATRIFAQETGAKPDDPEKFIEKYLDSLRFSCGDSLSCPDSPGERMIHAALFLLNTPYSENTLEVNEEESLVIHFRALDCMTFVENCLALSRTTQSDSAGYDFFARQLTAIRYRNGIIAGYSSRLHYVSDWIFDNSAKGTIEDITCALGGENFPQQVGFMSAHPELYPKLRGNPPQTERMIAIERAINQRASLCYIPKKDIKRKQAGIESGDIICFTTRTPGLDVSHVGIACRSGNLLTFIHASASRRKVIVNPEPLEAYCNRLKTNTGIIVLRPSTLID